MSEIDGFYGVYYAGPDAEAAFGLMMYKGRLYAVDPTGGDLTGTYTPRDDGNFDVDIELSMRRGSELVTGQKVEHDTTIPHSFVMTVAALAGEYQSIRFPFGTVNIRLVRKLKLGREAGEEETAPDPQE